MTYESTLTRWPCAKHGAAVGEPCEAYQLADGSELIAICGRDQHPHAAKLVQVSGRVVCVESGAPAPN